MCFRRALASVGCGGRSASGHAHPKEARAWTPRPQLVPGLPARSPPAAAPRSAGRWRLPSPPLRRTGGYLTAEAKKKPKKRGFTTNGTTMTLTQSCTTTKTITVPDGVTLDGAGFTITESGKTSKLSTAVSFDGRTGTVKNLTIDGSNLSGKCAVDAGAAIRATFPSGPDIDFSVTDVTIRRHPCGGVFVDAEAGGTVELRRLALSNLATGDQKAAVYFLGD